MLRLEINDNSGMDPSKKEQSVGLRQNYQESWTKRHAENKSKLNKPKKEAPLGKIKEGLSKGKEKWNTFQKQLTLRFGSK